MGRAPKQYSTCSAVSKHKIVIISKTKGVLSKNSSDLGLGRCPIAISDEFVESTPPSYRDIDVPFSDFFRKRYIVRERDPVWECACGQVFISSGYLRERDADDVVGSLRTAFSQRTGKASAALSGQHPSLPSRRYMLCYVIVENIVPPKGEI